MNRFDKFLSRHINIELKCIDMLDMTILNEEHGHDDLVDFYVYAVDSAIERDGLEALDSSIPNNIPVDYNFDINVYDEVPYLKELKDDFDKEKNEIIPFFSNVHLNLVIRFSPRVKVTGGYDPVKSSYQGKGVGDVYINLYISAPTKEDVFSYINSNIAHEFLHAMEDYEHYFKDDSLHKRMNDVGYYNYLNAADIMSVYEKAVSNLLYMLNDSEINASISELYSEIRANNEIIDGKCDKHSIMEMIRKTNVYNKVMLCNEWMSELGQLNDNTEENRSIKKELLDYVNDKMNNVDIRVKDDFDIRISIDGNEPGNKIYFDAYWKILRYFNKQLRKFERRIMEQAPKMACDIYNKYGKYSSFEKKYPINNKYGRTLMKKDEAIDNQY